MAIGQVLWKTGVTGHSFKDINSILAVFTSPLILLGIVVYGLTTILWLYILSQAQISFVYPIQALAFIFVLIAGVFLFHESVSITRIIGIAVIFLGVVLITTNN